MRGACCAAREGESDNPHPPPFGPAPQRPHRASLSSATARSVELCKDASAFRALDASLSAASFARARESSSDATLLFGRHIHLRVA